MPITITLTPNNAVNATLYRRVRSGRADSVLTVGQLAPSKDGDPYHFETLAKYVAFVNAAIQTPVGLFL